MKQFLRFLTFIVCFLFFYVASSQTYKLDEKRIYSYDGFNDIWVQNTTETYTYNNGGNKETSIIGTSFPSGNNQYRHIKTYDVNNNIISDLKQTWNISMVQWEDASRDTYTYYSGTSNIKDITTYSFDVEYNTFKVLYEYSGTDITKITFQDGSSGTLVNFQKYEYTYNLSGQPATEDDFEWNTSTNMWELDERGTATYTSGLRELITEQLNGSNWELFERYLTYYTISIEKDNEHIQQYRSGSNWVNSDRETSTYDANDNKTEYIFYSWISSAWEPYYKEEMNYSMAVPLSTNLFKSEDIKVYPNPATDFVTISTQKHIDKIELYNVLGYKILETKDTKIINVQSLNAGVYLLKTLSNTTSVTKRIVVE